MSVALVKAVNTACNFLLGVKGPVSRMSIKSINTF